MEFPGSFEWPDYLKKVEQPLEELLNVDGQPEVQARLKADMEAVRAITTRMPLPPDVIIY